MNHIDRGKAEVDKILKKVGNMPVSALYSDTFKDELKDAFPVFDDEIDTAFLIELLYYFPIDKTYISTGSYDQYLYDLEKTVIDNYESGNYQVDSLRRAFPNWDVYITPQLNDEEYRREREWNDMIADLLIHENADLHLATSVRSFRTPDLAAFVKAVLDVDTDAEKELYARIKDKYPIMLTRDLNKAKEWVRSQCQGTTRYGLLASSGALRLKPEGIFVKNEISVANWFLNGKDDVRSSYYLEDVVTEFDIQGLELDYSIVAWDADFRFDGEQWTYNNFVGNRWMKVASEDRRLYLKNTYRVLLTRARQGMVIFIPEGSDTDETRKREWYDRTYDYLRNMGIDDANTVSM